MSPVILSYKRHHTTPCHTQYTLSGVHTSHQFHMHSPWQLLLGPHFSSSNSNHQVQMLGHWGSACRQNYKHLGKSLPHSSNGLNIFFFKHFACKFQPPALVVLWQQPLFLVCTLKYPLWSSNLETVVLSTWLTPPTVMRSATVQLGIDFRSNGISHRSCHIVPWLIFGGRPPACAFYLCAVHPSFQIP